MKILRIINIIVNGFIVIPFLLFFMIIVWMMELGGYEEKMPYLLSACWLSSALLHAIYCGISCRRGQRGQLFHLLRYLTIASNICLLLPVAGYFIYDGRGFVGSEEVIILVILFSLNAAAISESWFVKPEPYDDCCPECGYDLRGSGGVEAGCPECGWGRGEGN